MGVVKLPKKLFSILQPLLSLCKLMVNSLFGPIARFGHHVKSASKPVALIGGLLNTAPASLYLCLSAICY